MTPREISDSADRLHLADETGTKSGLLSAAYPNMQLADAYAVQAAFIARRMAGGRAPIGWKIGFTSKAIQRQMKADAPGSGILLDDMAIATGGQVPAGKMLEPRVEAEIAFVMKSPLEGERVTRDDVAAATDHVVPALELLTTRVVASDPASGKARAVTDAIASNIACAGFVLGDRQHRVDAFDLRRVGVIVMRNGAVEETGLGAAVLGDPVASVLWLVHHLARRGQRIAAGEIILSGSLIRPIDAPAGSVVEAAFGDFGTARVSFA